MEIIKSWRSPLRGNFQVANAVLALEAVQALEKCGYEIKETAIRKGLRETVWNGRLQSTGRTPVIYSRRRT